MFATRSALKASSSGRWLARQKRDPFVRARAAAQASLDAEDDFDPQVATEPLRARSGFKIQELDAKYHILRGNVVDLGAAPGGWSQIAARSKRVKKVVAVDLLPIDPMPGVKTLQGDFLTWEVQKAVRDLLRPGEGPTPSKKERKAAEVAAAEPAVVPTVPPPNASNAVEVELADDHVSADEGDAVDDTDEKRTPRLKPARADTVLSDMMAAMSGVKARDTQASLDLVEAATEFAHSVLKPGGAMALKFFTHPDLVRFRKQQLEPCFQRVITDKPKSSRSESAEAYWVCLGYKGRSGLKM